MRDLFTCHVPFVYVRSTKFKFGVGLYEYFNEWRRARLFRVIAVTRRDECLWWRNGDVMMTMWWKLVRVMYWQHRAYFVSTCTVILYFTRNFITYAIKKNGNIFPKPVDLGIDTGFTLCSLSVFNLQAIDNGKSLFPKRLGKCFDCL